MRGADRPASVRRWVRRPLWWAAAAIALAGALFYFDVRSANSSDIAFDRGVRVTGTVTPEWDGGPDLGVTYLHPETGEVVCATTHVWDGGRLPEGLGPVELEVSRANPADVVVLGDRFSGSTNLGSYAPWALFPLLIWGVRRWSLSRTERVMASDESSYLMTASASAPRWWQRRWRLHLYPLDGGPTSRPVLTVPLVDGPSTLGSFAVEVKGSPRPYGRVAVRHHEGELLWPSGRALRSPGKQLLGDAPRIAAVRTSTLARWLLAGGATVLAVGVVALSLGTDANDVRERADVVVADVARTNLRGDGRFDVAVSFQWRGATCFATVTENVAPTGRQLAVSVDRERPTRVWSTMQATPPGSQEHEIAGFLLVSGLGMLIAAVVVSVRWDRRPAT